MADETTLNDSLNADRASAAAAEAERQRIARFEADKAEAERKRQAAAADQAKVKVAAKPDDTTGAARLRAFEDKHLGRRAVRSNDGRVERGYGSPFKEMSPELAAEHAALEKLVEAEAKVDQANAELSVAKAAVETAKEDVVTATKVADAAATEARRDAEEDARAEKPVEQRSVDPAPTWAPAPEPRLDAFGKPIDPAQKGL